MWQYILYFILGGSIVALEAYLANHSNQLLTILVGNLPVLFLLNVIMVYSAGGATSGIAYARGALISLPFFYHLCAYYHINSASYNYTGGYITCHAGVYNPVIDISQKEAPYISRR